MSTRAAAILAVALLAQALGPAAGPRGRLLAQSFYFGKNKIQYVDFDWQVLRGEHVDIYYYPEEREIAEIALAEAESSYLFLEEKFRHHVFRRIPLILYSSHQDFEQTNVTPYFLPEGVGGLTEFLKGRVTLPFNGSLYDFRRVIRHEMVHVFELGKLSRARAINRRFQSVQPPLWVTEGLAEYWSGRWGTLGDQVLRDLVLHNRLTDIREIWRYNGSFAVYKIGQSIFEFLGERHGDDRIRILYEEMGRGGSFAGAFERAYGAPLEEVGRRWIRSLKERYYPEVARLTELELQAEKIGGDRPGFQPVPYRGRDGVERVAYVTTRTGFTDICSRPVDGDGEGRRTLLKGGRDALLESLHPFASGIDVSREGLLAFSSKYHDRDALILLDVETGDIVQRYQFRELVGITSPAWSPAGDRVVFSGLTPAGYLDLFELHVADGRLRRLTNDRFADRDPAYSPDGERVVFSSDRSPWGERGSANLFLLDMESGEIRYVTSGPWRDESPDWDGEEILFVSDREGVRHLYAVPAAGGEGRRLAAFTSGAYSPRWLPDREGVVFAALDDQSFSIYRMDDPGKEGGEAVSFLSEEAPELPAWGWVFPARDTSRAEAVERYKRDFSLDVAQGGVGFSSNFGNSQGAILVMTDMLGDQMLAFQVFNTASSTSDFLDSFSGSVTYLNRKSRLNRGWGAYHFKGNFLDLRRGDTPFSERQFGGFFLLSYPFSKFLRVEGSFILSHSNRKDFITEFSRDSWLVTNVFSLVRDNSLWLPTGPIDGERINVTVGVTNDLTRARTDNATVQVDLRKYFRTSLRTAWAVRLLGRISQGTLPDRFYIGGSWTLRGYPRFSIIGTRVLLLNQEWRFPLLNRLIFRFPFGDIAFPPFQGALFLDAGNAWDEEDGWPGLLGSFGLGIRFSLGGPLVLRFDLARRTDFASIDPGTAFDFFFGYNY